MGNHTTDRNQWVNDRKKGMEDMGIQLATVIEAQEPDFGSLEQLVLPEGRELLRHVLARACARYSSQYVDLHRDGPYCGGISSYQRRRTVTVHSLLGDITYSRAYYLCPQCHHVHALVDKTLGVMAGCLSDGLHELCAFTGMREAFEEASAIIQKLSLVSVCPNTVRNATESVGDGIMAAEHTAVTQAFDPISPTIPPEPQDPPERWSISLDGNMVHTREEGWKENKLGAVSTTTETPSRHRPEIMDVRAQHISYVTDFVDPQTFGKELWIEAYRRGVTQTQEVVVIGDGAAGIWKLAEEHFPGAIQILDWYHATEYLWKVADPIYGTGTALSKHWAKIHLDALWDGNVAVVITELSHHAAHGGAVTDAITYYTHHQDRMQYATYRDRGIQIGSGTIERGGKHVIAHRLKQAGMIWKKESARGMDKTRTWRKSGKWNAAMALRPNRQRTYQRSSPIDETGTSQPAVDFAHAA